MDICCLVAQLPGVASQSQGGHWKIFMALCVSGSVGISLSGTLPIEQIGAAPDLSSGITTFEDGSTWRTLRFETVPGVQYAVQSSNDLENWTTDATVYGLGFEIVVPMHEVEAPPPVPPPNPLPDSPAPPTIVAATACVTLRPVAGGGIEVGWRSLDAGHASRKQFPGLSMDPAWELAPLYCGHFEDHQFLVFRVGGEAAAGVGDKVHGPQDQALLDAFEAAFPAMNAEVAASSGTRPATAPSPPVEGARRFWRVRVEWGLDSDADRTPDWAEFAGALAAGVPAGGPAYDAFAGDEDGSGIADGYERSRDGDAIPDALDASPDDVAVDWEKSPTWRYALFPLGVRQSPGGAPAAPLQVNDQGMVLYPTGTWLGVPTKRWISSALGMWSAARRWE